MKPALPRASITTTPVCKSAHDFSHHAGMVGEFEHARSFNPSFTRVASFLPQINITRLSLRKTEAVHLVREQLSEGRQELAFNAQPFVLCGLPLRNSIPTDYFTRDEMESSSFKSSAIPSLGCHTDKTG